MQSVFSALDAIWGKLTNRPVVPYFKMLTDTGEPDGNYDIIGDYSVTPQDFFIQPPIGANYLVVSVSIFISLADQANLASFGNTLALINGMNYYHLRSGSEDWLNEFLGPIKTNEDLAVFSGSACKVELLGPYDLYCMTFSLMEQYGQPLVIRGNSNDRLIARANDDLTGLDVHKIIFRGMRQGISRGQLL